jgi:hypothetical protein
VIPKYKMRITPVMKGVYSNLQRYQYEVYDASTGEVMEQGVRRYEDQAVRAAAVCINELTAGKGK